MKSVLRDVKDVLSGFLVTYYSELEAVVGNVQSLLDIGCGVNSPIKHFRKRIKYTVGVDGFEPSLRESQREGIHDEYRCLDLLQIEREFGPKRFDCVFASDVIEHFSKEDGLRLVSIMETIARERVVIFTPNGFLPQSEHSGNPLQRHRSGWTAEEMQAKGYGVIGINGWKPLLGELSLPRFRPRLFWTLVSRATQPLVRNSPHHAFQILCVKDMRKDTVSKPNLENQM